MKWNEDKIKHYNYCYDLVYNSKNKIISSLFVLICGILKEIIDPFVGGNCEIRDLYANILGIYDALLQKEKRI